MANRSCEAIADSAQFAGALRSFIFQQSFLAALQDEFVRYEEPTSRREVRKLRLYAPYTGDIRLDAQDSILNFHYDGIVFLEAEFFAHSCGNDDSAVGVNTSVRDHRS